MKNYFVYPNVVGYGRAKDRVAVLVWRKVPENELRPQEIIPKFEEEGQTNVIEVGDIVALRTGRFRPAPGGVSIGHFAITAGTLGTRVYDSNNRRLILSNNHVLANSNNGQLGDAILQPGSYDGGGAEDQIAELLRFIPIKFESVQKQSVLSSTLANIANFILQLMDDPCRLREECPDGGVNVIDAALAGPINDADLSDEVLDIGVVSGIMEAEIGMQVRKSGRTTGLSFGEVQIIDAVVKVGYGGGRMATFERQIITSNISEGGDSGSLLVHAKDNVAVGLLFAGSSQVTVHNPIGEVLNLLEVTI